jgi:hypothetical protein
VTTGVTIAHTGPWMTVAAMGPVPYSASTVDGTPGPSPSFFNDTDTVFVQGVSGNHLAGFTSPNVAVPDSWVLSTGSQALLGAGGSGHINLGGSTDVTFGCDTTKSVHAYATLTVPAGSQVTDGDTIMINDGNHLPVTFEYDSNGAITAGNVAITFLVGDTQDMIAAKTKAAIEAVNVSKLGIVHPVPVATGALTLTNVDSGAAYNSPGAAGASVTLTVTQTAAYTLVDFANGANGCPTDSAGTIVIIDTTDGDVATGCHGRQCGLNEMPTPKQYKGQVVCTALTTQVTIDHRMLNAINNGVTKKQITVLQANFQADQGVNGPNQATFVVGRGYVAITPNAN